MSTRYMYETVCSGVYIKGVLSAKSDQEVKNIIAEELDLSEDEVVVWGLEP